MTKGCEWDNPVFKVFMSGGNRKEFNKCLRCRKYKGSECKTCVFEDRGYILIDKKTKHL